MTLKHNILTSLLLPTIMLVAGCTIEEMYFADPTPIDYRGEPVEAFLDVSVGGLLVSTGTRADDADLEDSEAERWVNDLWVFQYNASTGIAVADPIYVDMAKYDYDQSILENMPVTLSDNVGDDSVIYVVTNTGDSSWGSEAAHNTVDGLLASTLPTHEPIFFTDTTDVSNLSIPMEGDSGNVMVEKGRTVRVPVSRMYAKLMIDPITEIYTDVDITDEYGNVTGTESVKAETLIYSVTVGNIPLYCRVGSLWDEVGTSAASYPDDVQWISRAFDDEVVDGSTGSGEGGGSGSGSDVEDLGYRYIVYVPENLQGVVGGEGSKTDNAPSHALQINIVITYFDPTDNAESHYPYTVYPGMNSTNDFNIRRNNIYRVKVNINELSVARVPSANCFVALEGHTLSFFPYYRVETGGGYDFTEYLDPFGVDEADGVSGIKIDHVGIIWQTKDCIGNNDDGSLVYLSTNSATHTGFEQIHVKVNKEGNALIGAFDKANNIAWSWHIWVRTEANGDPTHPANALVYYTYDWNSNGINGIYQNGGNDVARVAGYEIMSCNLGALQDKPNWDKCTNLGTYTNSNASPQLFNDEDGIVRTFGMLYQWGRKDPFPPMITTEGNHGNLTATSTPPASEYLNTGYYPHDYDDEHTEQLYGNDNATLIHKTAYDENGPTYSGATKYSDGYLFHTHIHTDDDFIKGMRYAIAYPTVFLSGYKEIGYSLTEEIALQNTRDADTFKDNMALVSNYIYDGAWSDEDHDNREWGGIEPTESTMRYGLGIYDDSGHEITLYDDYGDEKSIFDPCPYGWRVGSGDLWLGFTKSGISTNFDPWDSSVVGDDPIMGTTAKSYSFENVNFDTNYSNCLGMSMYLGDGWRAGSTSWFPNQGFRLPDGCGYRVGGCGNYVNANTDANDTYDRVNIIHIHGDPQYFKQFETQLHYTVKSTANPLRCVRDSK